MPRRVDTFVSWTLSLLVHVAIAAVLFVTIEVTAPPSVGQQEVETIQATVVDQAQLDAAKRAKEEEARRQAEAERRRREQLEAERRAREEQQRKAEEEEARRKAEEKARREAEAERQRQAEAEAKRRAEEEARRKAEEEARRKAEEEARRKAEAEARARREAELKQAMAAEQQRQEAIRSGKLAEYQALLTQKVVRNWTPPANLGEEFYCELEVRQIPGGEIASVNIRKCDNDILGRSAEVAAWKASPLPPPPDRSLFDPVIRIIFSPATTDQ